MKKQFETYLINSEACTLKKNESYHLTRKVKNQVTFKCINIFENEFTQLPNFDYIFSRNMLIYFDTQT